jgi:hypothetical protein
MADQDEPLQDDEQEQPSGGIQALLAALRGGQNQPDPGMDPSDPTQVNYSLYTPPIDPGFTAGGEMAAARSVPNSPYNAALLAGKKPTGGVSPSAAPAPAASDDPTLGGGSAPAPVVAPSTPTPAGAPMGSTSDLEQRGLAARMRPAPAPTDDPDGPDGPELPKPPDLTNSPLAALLKDYRDTQGKLAAIPPVDPAANKPRLWERLLGGLSAGAIAYGSKDPAMGASVGGEVTTRRLDNARKNYDIQTAPLLAHLQQDREGMGIAEAQSKIPQKNFENQLSVAKEGRATASAKSLAQHRSDLDDIRQQIADNNVQKASDMIDQKQKELDARTGFQKDTLDLRQQLGEMRIQMREKELDAKQNPNGYTPGENQQITSQSRRYQTRINSLEKTRGDYIGSNRPEDKQTLAAIDAEIEQNHQAIDKVENDVMAKRKPSGAGAGNAAPAPSPTVTPAPAAKPNAQPSAAPKYAKTASDGKGNQVGYDAGKNKWVPIPKTK